METRLLVAYALIAAIAILGSGWIVRSSARKRAHKRRMRGIKVDQNRVYRERAR